MDKTSTLQFDRYESVFKALANEQRLKIMYLLYCVDDKVTVSEFAYVFEDSQSNASRQLKVLREAGMLEKLREGKWTYYSVAEPLDPFVHGVLEAISTIPESFVAKEIDRCNYLVAERDAQLASQS